MKSSVAAGLIAGWFVSNVCWAQPMGQPAPASPAYAAQPAPVPPAYSPDTPPDSAMLLQARMQTQMGLLSVVSSTPGFLVGYQLKGIALGVGFGLTRAGLSADLNGNNSSTTGTLFAVTPTVILDVWRSADQRTRANLVGSIGYGRASLTSKSHDCYPYYNGTTTVQQCTDSESKSSANMIPLQLGFGGDHFLSRHFGLGAEAGLQWTLFSGVESTSQTTNGTPGPSPNRSANMQAFYGVFRFTLLLGG